MIPRNWRLQQQRYRLTGQVCEHCNEMVFPPRTVCPKCKAAAQTPLFFGGRENGSMVTAQLDGSNAEQVRIGIPVEVVARSAQNGGEERVIVYGYKPRLVTNPAS